MARLSRAHNFILLMLRDRGYTEKSDIVKCLILAKYHGCLVNKPFDRLMERGFLREDETGMIAITPFGRKQIKDT